MKFPMSKVLTFQQLWPKMKDQIMPIQLAYKLSRLYDSVDNNARFYSTELNKIVSEYAERDDEGNKVPAEEGNGVKLQKAYIPKAEAAVNDLLNLMVDVPDISFTLDELKDIKLSLEEFGVLLPFIKAE